ncbi:putative rac-like GTP-binding protein 7-like [Capsicum annuum]|nr:putative rac-like GTP-binding protein 7-like [Capsicum annuum]
MANTKVQTAAYPSAARIADSDCYPQYTASLKCLEQFNSDKSKCQEHFDVYKECKKKEVFLTLASWNAFAALCVRSLFFRVLIFLIHHFIYDISFSGMLQREARLERNRSRSLFS